MKKLIIIALAMVLCLGLAGIASATIVNSLHDFSDTSVAYSTVKGVADPLGASTGQVCVFCHHPHRGVNASLGNDLLWNMNSVGSANITGYSSATMNATTAAVNATAPQSFLCMTCHDGLIAAGALVQKPKDGSNTTADWWNDAAANATADLGSTLADDHPVNFTYTDASSVDTAGIKAPLANTVTGASANTYPLFGGTMQCATCHDVHAGTTTKDTGGIQFMRGDTAASEICVDCHINK